MTDVKAGRRNSKADEAAIRQAISLLESVLEDRDDPEDGEDDADANGAPEEQKQSNPRQKDLLKYIDIITKEE